MIIYERVQVWDVPVRLVHWFLVVLIAFSWWSGSEGGNMMTYHMWSGYSILTLLLFRIAWGFIGSGPARFTAFVRGPRTVCRYLGTMRDRQPSGHPGHNPLGGWSVVLMLASIALQAGTGLFANDDIMTEGPLYGWVSKSTSDLLTSIHHFNFKLLLTLVALHLAAIFFHLTYKSENLVGAMFTGIKRVAAPVEKAPMAGTARAVAIFLAAAAAVYLLVTT
jgi:Cytochrome b